MMGWAVVTLELYVWSGTAHSRAISIVSGNRICTDALLMLMLYDEDIVSRAHALAFFPTHLRVFLKWLRNGRLWLNPVARFH